MTHGFVHRESSDRRVWKSFPRRMQGIDPGIERYAGPTRTQVNLYIDIRGRRRGQDFTTETNFPCSNLSDIKKKSLK